MGRFRRSAGKALSVDIYKRGDGRFTVYWKDETGKMRFTTRRSFSDAKKLQSEKIEEPRRHRLRAHRPNRPSVATSANSNTTLAPSGAKSAGILWSRCTSK